MTRSLRTLLVLSCVALVVPACGGNSGDAIVTSTPEGFQSGLEASIKAAERGKELVKSPGKKAH